MNRIILLLALFLTYSIAWATATHTTGLYSVPAPGAVVVDGNLADWDLSGRVLICGDFENLRDSYSAQVSMMYDADNLYVALQWKDSVPMGNQHDPKTSNMGWAGDSVQLRMVTDRIITVTAWLYAANNEPCIAFDYGKGDAVFGGGSRKLMQVKGSQLEDGAEMACQKDADGKGYSQEIKIPWKLIAEKNKYLPGDSFNCGIELLWGEDTGTNVLKRVADNVKPGALPVDESVFYLSNNDWGMVTLEKKGHIKLPEPGWVKILKDKSHAGTLKIAKFRGGADAAVSYTFDDGSQNQLDIAIPILNEFKVKSTFFVVFGVVRDKKEDPMLKGAARSGNGGLCWDELRTMAAMGHEIGNHSLTHRGLIGAGAKDPAILEHEINDSAKLIAAKMGLSPVSFCYAGNGRDGAARAVVMQHHIVDRRYCVGYGGKDFTVATANGYIDKAIKEHDWTVPMIHGIEEGYSPLTGEILRQHLQYVQKLGDSVWVETFGNVARYQQEREDAILKVTSQHSKKVTFTLKSSLNAGLYNYPLTIEIPTPGYTAKDVTVEQRKSSPQPIKVLDGKILVDVIPGKYSVTVRWK